MEQPASPCLHIEGILARDGKPVCEQCKKVLSPGEFLVRMNVIVQVAIVDHILNRAEKKKR